MRYLLVFLLQLCLHSAEPRSIRYANSRQRRRIPNDGVKGSSRRRIKANIFQLGQAPYIDPFAGEPKYSGGLTLKATSQFTKPKASNEGNGKGKVKGKGDGKENGSTSSLPVLNIPKTTPSTLKLGKQMGPAKSTGVEMHAPTTAPSSSPPSSGTGESTNHPTLIPVPKPMPTKYPTYSSESGISKYPKNIPTGKSTKYPTYTSRPPSTGYPTLSPGPKSTGSSTSAPNLNPPGSSSKGKKSKKTGKSGVSGPTSIPTFAPTKLVCTVDKSGIFGLQSGNITLYDFFYQLEVIQGITAEDVDLNLLGPLEIAMANLLIPILFPKLCGSTGERRRLQDGQGQFIGLSTSPSDFVLTECELINSRLSN